MKHVPRAAIAAALTAAGLLGGASAAQAAVTVTGSAANIVATGDGAADSIFVRNGTNPNFIRIQAPGSALADPDGAGAACAVISADTVECDTDSVLAVGGAGNDTLANELTSVNPNRDANFDGGADNDTLTSAATFNGDQSLNGGTGDDSITDSRSAGFGGSSSQNGGEGNDTLTDSRATSGFVSINGADGNDVISVSGPNTSSVDLDGGAGDDSLTDGRTYTQGFGGGSTADLVGGDGNDTLNGGEFRQRFFPGAGSDVVRGGSAPVDARAGFPSYVANDGDPELFERQVGGDSVSYSGSGVGVNVSLDNVANDGAAGEGDDIGADVEFVTGSNFNDVLSAGGAAVFLEGLNGDDTLNGGGGKDVLFGGNQFFAFRGGFIDGSGGGADTINGGGGDDFLVDSDLSPNNTPDPANPPATPPSPTGADRLNGGDGDDFFDTDAGADDIVGGAGQDSASFSRTAPTPFPVPTDPNFVRPPVGFNISLDDQPNDGPAGEGDNVHSDVEEINTSRGDDVITGSAASNRVFSGSGNDNVTGGGGADVIDTGRGNDTIAVQDGVTDRVDGGEGNDSATADLPGGQPEKADVLLNVENVTGVALPTVVDASLLNKAPALTVTGLKFKVKSFLKKGTFTLKVRTDERARINGDALGKNKFRAIGDIVVGNGRLGLGTGRRNLKISVGKSNLKTFKRKLRSKSQRKKGIKLRVRVVATDTGGLSKTVTKTVTIKG